MWVDKGNEFYNRSMKSWWKDNDLEVIQHIMKEHLFLLKDLLEPRILCWKKKLYKYMTLISKLMYIDKLDNNNTIMHIIKMNH